MNLKVMAIAHKCISEQPCFFNLSDLTCTGDVVRKVGGVINYFLLKSLCLLNYNVLVPDHFLFIKYNEISNDYGTLLRIISHTQKKILMINIAQCILFCPAPLSVLSWFQHS